MSRALLALALSLALGGPALQVAADLFAAALSPSAAPDAGNGWDPNGGSQTDAGNSWDPNGGAQSDAGGSWDPNG